METIQNSYLPIVFAGVGLGALFLWKCSSQQNKIKMLPHLLRGTQRPVSVVLDKKTMVNHNTMLLNLKFPGQDMTLGTKIGEHILLFGKDFEGKQIKRSYTPISRVDKQGSLDLLIKVYFKTDVFPGGAMTNYLYNLPEKSQIQIAGPKGDFNYLGNNKFYIKSIKQTKKYNKISMISGGTGITPMYQVIQHIASEQNFNMDIRLLNFNVTEEDILLRKELEELKDSNKLKIKYSLDKPGENWKEYKGYFQPHMAEEFLEKPNDDHLILICGPPRMVVESERIMCKLGHDEDNIFLFQ